MFEWRAKKYEIDENHRYFKELLAYFRIATPEDFFHQLGNHQLSLPKIAEFIQLKKEGKELPEADISEKERAFRQGQNQLATLGLREDALILDAKQNIDRISTCDQCNPLAGDDILGFPIEDTIVIHRTVCPEAQTLMSTFGSKIIKAQWTENTPISFLTAIKVVGLDKQGMLIELLKVISNALKINIRKVTIASRDGMFEGVFGLYISDKENLEHLMEKIRKVPNVYTVSRTDNDLVPYQIQNH